MSKSKTVRRDNPVDDLVARIDDPQRRADSERLLDLMRSSTGVEPVLWGTSVIGFGTNHYHYATGREGDTVAVGFATRARALVLYGLRHDQWDPATKGAVGKITTGVGCIYIKRMDDVDAELLGGLIKRAFVDRHNVGT